MCRVTRRSSCGSSPRRSRRGRIEARELGPRFCPPSIVLHGGPAVAALKLVQVQPPAAPDAAVLRGEYTAAELKIVPHDRVFDVAIDGSALIARSRLRSA